MIKQYRTTHPNVIAVSGGGWGIPGTLESQKIQSYFLMDFMGSQSYSVVNVTPVDLSFGVESLRQQALKSKLSLVSANLVQKSTGKLAFEPYVVQNVKGIRVGFTGVMEEGEAIAPLSNEGDDLEVVDPKAAVQTILPELRTKCDVVVCFSHLTQRKTQQLCDEVKGIDIAVSGKDGFVNFKPTEVGNDSTGKSLVLEAGERGKYLGALTFVVSEHGKILRYNHEAHSLDKNVKDDSTVAASVTAMKERMKEARKREAVEQAVGQSPQSTEQSAPHEKFLGGQVCARCHVAEYESWKESKHAHSLATLEAKAMDQSADCLKCHVTGYSQPGGYPSLHTELSVVSCEECHGVGTMHGDPKFVARPTAESCTVCHDKKNSPKFDYKSYWAKIAHGPTALGMNR